jgi:tetratricopeptide (TPR) repeat protein
MEREVTIIAPVGENDAAQETQEMVCLPIRTAIMIAQNYLPDISSEDLYTAESALKELAALVDRLIHQAEKPGSANEWHNLSVDIARENLYGLACDLLACALTIFPKNVTLLADYLQYGISCGRIENCKAYYKVLAKIPKIRWDWRGYSFSISYLTYLWEQSDSEKELDKLQNEMLSLVEDFRKNLPLNEESYTCEADICGLLHQEKEQEAVLRLALDTLQLAPKCALRLSDILFDRGEYEDALKLIQRGLHDTMQTQRAINEGYLYYLSGLAKMALAQQSETPFSEEIACDIYADFDIALRQGSKNSDTDMIKAKAIILISKSDVLIPEKYEELNRLVQWNG